MAKPLRGREEGTEGRANLNKATHTHGGKAINTKEKMAKHANKQKGGRGTAAQAQREEAVPMGKTHTRASSPKKAAHTHCGQRRREDPTTAKLASKQKGAGRRRRRTAARDKRKEAAPSGKSNSFASTSMIQTQGRDSEQT